jgi:hypothetical protein
MAILTVNYDLVDEILGWISIAELIALVCGNPPK